VSINLEEIVERAVPMSGGHYLAVRAEDFNALVAEVEHLRAAIAALQASVPPTHPSDYGHEVWAAARHEAVAKERAAVVAYLRRMDRTFCYVAALDIAQGEHRREEEK